MFAWTSMALTQFYWWKASLQSFFVTFVIWFMRRTLPSNTIRPGNKKPTSFICLFSVQDGWRESCWSLEIPIKLPAFVAWAQTISPENLWGSRKWGVGEFSRSLWPPPTPSGSGRTCCRLVVWTWRTRARQEAGALGFIVSTRSKTKPDSWGDSRAERVL